MHKKSAYIQLQQQTLAKNVQYNVHKTSIYWTNTKTLIVAGFRQDIESAAILVQCSNSFG